jgi:endonuclease/exonuclease/phosphatase family metal-dependent hydrolase
MGDLNTAASDPQIQRLLAVNGVCDAVAQANKNHVPEKRIDWIFTRGLRCITAGHVPTVASDHPVVWAELEISLPKAADRLNSN